MATSSAASRSLVDQQQDLHLLIERLRSVGSFAYDSEFIGEMSYVPKLCLIQIATEQEIALVDPLADLDLMPLWELFADPAVQKIVHAGAQDMEPVIRMLGRPATNVLDTQIAAGFARLPYPISLQRMVLQLLGIKLGKGLTFTHWDQRPLSSQQTRYAADDVPLFAGRLARAAGEHQLRRDHELGPAGMRWDMCQHAVYFRPGNLLPARARVGHTGSAAARHPSRTGYLARSASRGRLTFRLGPICATRS